MTISVSIQGLKEIDANLVKLGKVAGAKIMRGSLYAASKPILDQAKANTAAWPKGSGALNLALGRRYTVAASDVGGSKFSISVGPKVKHRTALALYNLYYKRHVKGIFYAHLLERGHRKGSSRTGYLKKIGRLHGSGGSSIGDVPARPFLLPALKARQAEAIQILATKLRAAIARALRK